MIRLGSAGSFSRPAFRFITSSNRKTSNLAIARAHHASVSRVLVSSRSKVRELIVYKPFSTSLQKSYAAPEGSAWDKQSQEQKDVSMLKLEPHPEEVSNVSSVHQVFHEKGEEDPEPDIDMLAGVKSDIRAIKETFALHEVPREALVIGMAGVLPYLATSLSTIYLAWDINYATTNGTGFLVSGQTAELLLHIVEPLQIGYGAVILSFLGAIHWGLEFAKYGGVQKYNRFAYGVVAPAVAWPTLLLPVEYALIAQFCAFNFMYYADANAVVRGWAPHWYTTYRFVLTFVVGASIVLSLIGRGRIADKLNKLPGPADRIKALRDSQLESLEQEEREKRARYVAEEESGGEEEEEEEEEGDDE